MRWLIFTFAWELILYRDRAGKFWVWRIPDRERKVNGSHLSGVFGDRSIGRLPVMQRGAGGNRFPGLDIFQDGKGDQMRKQRVKGLLLIVGIAAFCAFVLEVIGAALFGWAFWPGWAIIFILAMLAQLVW